MPGRPSRRAHFRLEIGEIQPLHIGPDQPRRMILADQRLDIDRLEPHLVAHRNAKPRPARRQRPTGRRRLLRKIIKKTVHRFALKSKSNESVIQSSSK
jgi:hypothetical protein